jgi:hypothetical protein
VTKSHSPAELRARIKARAQQHPADLCAKAHELTPFGFSILFEQGKNINNTKHTP